MNEPLHSPDPADLALWGLHAFCLGARRTPHRVVMADNNGRILYLAREGTTRAALAEATRPELLLVAGHEFIWDVMAELCAQGHVGEPAVLRADTPGVEALRVLVFIRAGD